MARAFGSENVKAVRAEGGKTGEGRGERFALCDLSSVLMVAIRASACMWFRLFRPKKRSCGRSKSRSAWLWRRATSGPGYAVVVSLALDGFFSPLVSTSAAVCKTRVWEMRFRSACRTVQDVAERVAREKIF